MFCCHTGIHYFECWMDESAAGTHPVRQKHKMPINDYTIEDRQNKTSHLLFSFFQILLFISFCGLVAKMTVVSLPLFCHFHNYTLYRFFFFKCITHIVPVRCSTTHSICSFTHPHKMHTFCGLEGPYWQPMRIIVNMLKNCLRSMVKQ